MNEGASSSRAPELPPDVDVDLFKNFFSIPSTQAKEPRKIMKIFSKRNIPNWLKELGEVKINEDGKNAVVISEALFSMVAGYEDEAPLKFALFSEVDLLREIILLGNLAAFPDPPVINGFKARLGWQAEALRGQLKALFCMFAYLNKDFAHIIMNQGLMENVVLPGLKGLVDSIQASVRHMRFEALPKGVSKELKKKFVERPMFPLWPEDVASEIRQFFLGRRFSSRRSFSRGRGGFRGGFRGQTRNRGFFGRARRGWGGRRGFATGQKKKTAAKNQ